MPKVANKKTLNSAVKQSKKLSLKMKAQQNPSKIKTAAELGIKAESLGIAKRKAKTHKGRKIMESREAKLIEDH